MTDSLDFDFQWSKAKNGWHSIDAHFHEGARSVLLSFFPVNIANILIIYNNDHIAFDLPDLQHKKLWTLHWRSIWELGRVREARSCAYEASQYCI